MTEKKISGDLDQFSYALGMSIAGNLIQTGVKKVNSDVFIEAFNSTFKGEMPKIHPSEANSILETYIGKINEGQETANLEEGLQFLAENLSNEGVVELPSGLQYKVLKEGTGKKPAATDQVKCHYHGTLTDGTVFDSSVERGQPAVFPVNGVIQGWVEALQLMNTGSIWKLFIPSNLAYGQQGAGGAIGPNSTLVFDVELLEIV